MRISFNLSIDDLLAFYKLGLKKKSFIFKKYIFGVGVLIALLLSYYDSYIRNSSGTLQLSSYSNNFWFMSAYNLVFVTICIFLVRMITISLIRIQMRKKTKHLGNRDLEIVKGNLVFSSYSSKTEYPLKSIIKVEENRRHFFIYTNEISAIIVPKKTADSRAFINKLTEASSIKLFIIE